MPSRTAKQKWFMEKACKDPEFAKRNNVDQAVACEFYEADKKEAEVNNKKKPAYVKWGKKK